MVDRTDKFIRPRGYYDNKGNLLKIGFDIINGWLTGKTDTTDFDEHTAGKTHIGLNESVRVYNNANISINTATDTYIDFNSERFDNSDMHDNVTNSSRLTCKNAGKYLIIATIRFVANADGVRYVRIVKNRANVIAGVTQSATPADTCEITVSTLIDLAVNDYVEVRVQQTSGGALDVVYTNFLSPEFMMVKVG